MVSTAAAAAAVIPFHCVICFEEFNLGLRFPVVLPCGHTYVCNPCARKINRCMECREPLFLRPDNVPKTPPTNSHRGGPPLYPQGRYHQAPASPVPATSASHHEPIPLPLPKNIVLMSMMEAAERQQREDERNKIKEEKNKQVDENDDSSSSSSSSTDDDDDEEDEMYDLNRIISGMVTFSGPCGTYAVKYSEGLAVLPHHPEKHCKSETDADANKEQNEATPEPFTIVKGQTVQVVNFQDGVATLARGAGYIVATSSQLVKGE